MMKQFIKEALAGVGYELKRKPSSATQNEKLHLDTMSEGLQRAATYGSPFGTILDVGAAAGTWTEKAIRIWPNAKYLLFEPLHERQPDLVQLQRKHENTAIEIVPSAVGEEIGEVSFSVAEDLDGSAVDADAISDATRTVKMTSLDAIVLEQGHPKPYLIKLDTHGYEIPILEGAKQILSQTDLLIIEVYGQRIAKRSLLFYELCGYLDQQGFRPIDLVNTMRRPADYTFWQCDLFFAPKSHASFSDTTYH